jgi:hypothetical protein
MPFGLLPLQKDARYEVQVVCSLASLNQSPTIPWLASALALRPDYELLLSWVEADREQVGLAANLAIFHILLKRARRVVNVGRVPLSAIAALKAGLHSEIP